jgi:Flp pilus assembly pilin Flp
MQGNQSRRGATSTEYGMIVALIAVAIIGVLSDDGVAEGLEDAYLTLVYRMDRVEGLASMHFIFDEDGDGLVSNAEGSDWLIDDCPTCPTQPDFDTAYNDNNGDANGGLDEAEFFGFSQDWLLVDPDAFGDHIQY